MLARLKSRQAEHHYWGLSTALKPTIGVPYNSTYFETDTYTWFFYCGSGWVTENTGMDANISRLIQVSDHSIAITVINPALSQTCAITIDGVAVDYVSSGTPTIQEISDGLIAAFPSHAVAGKFIVTQGAGPGFEVILTPTGILEPVVTVTAVQLVDTKTDGFARINGTAGARLDAIYLDIALAGDMTLADAGVVKAIVVPPGAAMLSYFGAKFLTRLEIKLDDISNQGTVLWRAL
jgi:hypothetical protein